MQKSIYCVFLVFKPITNAMSSMQAEQKPSLITDSFRRSYFLLEFIKISNVVSFLFTLKFTRATNLILKVVSLKSQSNL